MSEYSMPSYFQTMPVIGKEVAHFSEENAAQIQEVEKIGRASCRERVCLYV